MSLPEYDDPTHEERPVDVLTYTVIPALPGTRLEWFAEWCPEGSVVVHAWVVEIDVLSDGRAGRRADMSCIRAKPMILASDDELQVADGADLAGKPGRVIEP